MPYHGRGILHEMRSGGDFAIPVYACIFVYFLADNDSALYSSLHVTLRYVTLCYVKD
jgi:hypothetical protein